MQVHARLRYLRMSPRKVRLVIDMVRGLSVDAAIQQLTFSPKEAAGPVLKLLKSAIANAENNHQLDRKTLKIAKITADGGPTLHRYRPRAFGRAAPIRKRTSHVQIILSDESPADVHKAQVKGGRKRMKTEVKKPVAAKSKKTVGAQRVAPKGDTAAAEKKEKKPAAKKTATK